MPRHSYIRAPPYQRSSNVINVATPLLSLILEALVVVVGVDHE